MSCAHTKNGSRNQVMPGARSCTIVVMKFIAPSSDEKMSSSIPTSHQRLAVPGARSESGGVRGPAVVGRAARHEEAGQHDDAAGEIEPVARHVQPRERHVGRADLQRHDVVAERAEGQRHDAEEHHDGAVHRARAGCRTRAAGCRRGRSLGRAVRRRTGCGCAGIGQLPPDQHDEREADQQEEQAGEPVLETDDLVVGGEDVPAQQLEDILLTPSGAQGQATAAPWCILLRRLHERRSHIHHSIEELKPMGFLSIALPCVGRAFCLSLRLPAAASPASAPRRGTSSGSRGRGVRRIAGRTRPDAGHRWRLPRLPHAEEDRTERSRGRHDRACCRATRRTT